ncbi:UNVERIFIED_CONTAM: Tigger transposable element-derived protein 4, partial [Sesamum indicum]
MNDQMRKGLCEYKRDHPTCIKTDLEAWVDEKYRLKFSQGTISNTLKRLSEYLLVNFENGVDIKRHKSAKYPDMEKVHYEWFIQYQDRVNMTGELILEKAKDIMKLLYPQHPPEHQISQGWLEKFKVRHGIKSFHHFGESSSVNMQDMKMKLEAIREKINQFSMKDVFNLDEIGLFYSLQADHSLTTKQLEGRKQDKERLTVVICYNKDGLENIPLWIIGKHAKPRCFKNINMSSINCHYRPNKRAWMTSVLFDEYVRCLRLDNQCFLTVIANCFRHCKIHSDEEISSDSSEINFEKSLHELENMVKDVGYRNEMNVNKLVDYPGENECSMVQSLEEIVADIIEYPTNNEAEDDSLLLEPVTRKEALTATTTLHNFLLQLENSTLEHLAATKK